MLLRCTRVCHVVVPALSVALMTTVGCDRSGPFDVPPVPPRDVSPLQTDSLSYTLTGSHSTEWSGELVVRYVNRGRATVYLPGCQPGIPISPQYGFLRAAPDTGRVIFSAVWGCVGGVPALPIPPGGSRIDTLRYVSIVSPESRPIEHPWERVGLMRVSYAIYAAVTETGEADYRTLLPEVERRSNVFELRYP